MNKWTDSTAICYFTLQQTQLYFKMDVRPPNGLPASFLFHQSDLQSSKEFCTLKPHNKHLHIWELLNRLPVKEPTGVMDCYTDSCTLAQSQMKPLSS